MPDYYVPDGMSEDDFYKMMTEKWPDIKGNGVEFVYTPFMPMTEKEMRWLRQEFRKNGFELDDEKIQIAWSETIAERRKAEAGRTVLLALIVICVICMIISSFALIAAAGMP